MKKVISLALALVMLLGMSVVVSAEETVVMAPTVYHSIAESEENGYSLAFLLTMYGQGLAVKDLNVFDNSNATVAHNGQQVKLVKMGVVVTLNGDLVANPDQWVIGAASTLNVEAIRLFDLRSDHCRFAVRITNIPAASRDANIYVRPYYIIEQDGVQETVYVDSTDAASYLGIWSYYEDEVELPAIGTDIDVKNKKGRIEVSAASYTYQLDETGENVEIGVSLTVLNTNKTWITTETDWVRYTYYDREGAALGTGTIYIGSLDTKSNKSKTYTFVVPYGTAEVALTNSKIEYWTEWV